MMNAPHRISTTAPLCVFSTVRLFSLQTIYFHHQPYPDFHPLLKCTFLPGTAHASLPDHNLLPERDLTSNTVLYQYIHTRYLAQPRFKLLISRPCSSPRRCSLRCRGITLCVSLIDQVEQVFHWRVVFWFCFR